MEITKPNDILIATINNPLATTYDLTTIDLNPINTGLLSKDAYKSTKYIQDAFKTTDGKFDEIAFNETYNKAANHYSEMSNDAYLKGLDEVTYSPFDVTRPKDAKTFKIDVEFTKDFNPFQQLYNRTSVGSVDNNPLSLREIAQQGKIFDTKEKKWSETTVNELGLLDKIFGETLVYAQWDDEGIHKDVETGLNTKHSKGDWKINDNGNIFVETLGDREMYGKQIVNPKDILTTDGSFANNLDLFDNDNIESNAIKTTFRLAAEIAPLVIPGVNLYYGGVKAAIGLAGVLPTFYKSLEGMFLGDTKTGLTDLATKTEGYLAKFNQKSNSDKAQGSFFNYEQLGGMVVDTFGQLYEQRAVASLSKYFVKSKSAALLAKEADLESEIGKSLFAASNSGKINLLNKTGQLSDEAASLVKAAREKLPELQSLQKLQSGIAKSLSLGYMAMTSTADIYGHALEVGYDRRTAGFSALLAASGQYGIMINNRMGDWFLEGTTGYSLQTNKTLMRKAVKEYMGDIQDGFKIFGKDKMAGKLAFSTIAKNFKNTITDTFTNGSVVGEAMWKNAMVEGVEEVTEQAVLDSTKAIVDAMSYLGLTEKKGNFNAIEKTFSKEGAQEYLANFIGGILGGAMFEFNTSKIEPLFNKNLVNPITQKSVQQYVANGHTDLLIDMVNKQRSRLGNNYLSPVQVDGMYIAAENNKSQADFIADSTISFIRNQDGIINGKNWGKSDAEIVEKTMMDQIAIKMFQDSKGENKVGIEGLLIDDFNNNREEFLRVNEKIKDLSKDTVLNKDAIAELKEEAKIYENNINDMLAGKKAEEYFNEASFYFEKEISDNFLNIDRDSFSRAKYGKSYNNIKDSGVGVTKERVDKEWKEVLNSTDVRKNIKTAFKVYSEIEKMINPSIAKYTEKGYSEEHKKSLQNIFKTVATLNLYDVSNPETKKENIRTTLDSAKKVEQATGKRIIPYDILSTDFVGQFFKMNLLSDLKGNVLTEEELNRPIKVEGREDTTIKQTISNLIESILVKSPSTSFVYDLIEKDANKEIFDYNNSVLSEIEHLKTTRNEENTEEIDKEIALLENSQMNIKLLTYNDTDIYKGLKSSLDKTLTDKFAELKLTDEDLIALNSVTNLEEVEAIKLESEDILDENTGITTTELNKESATSMFKWIELDKLRDKDGKSILEEIYNVYLLDPTKENLSKLQSNLEDTVKELQGKNKIYKQFKEFQLKEEDNLSKELEKSMPSYFSPKGNNYALPALLKEIKTNGNLDKEVFKLLESSIDDLLQPIKNMFSDNNFTKLELLDILENSDDYFNTLNDVLNSETVENDSNAAEWELTASKLPKYIKESIKSNIGSKTTFESAIDFLENIQTISEFKKNNKEDVNNIKEVSKVLEDADKFISNSLYDFIENFEVILTGQKDKSDRKSSIMTILKNEEFSLFKASDITNYSAQGIRSKDIDQVLNTLNLIKSVVKSMSTTEISMDSSTNGFLAMRQNFIERNKLKSDVSSLKTITSDTANMMLLDLARIESKLKYLQELSKFNSGKLFNESEEIRNRASQLFHKGWVELSKKSLMFKGKPVIPDLSNILSSNDSKEKQLLNIKDVFFHHHIGLNDDEKIELLKIIKEGYPHYNIYDGLYDKNGEDEFTKEMKELSNHDFFWSLASSLVVNSKDIYRKILSNLKGEFDKAPFYTQELAAEMLYASIVAPKIFSELLKDDIHTSTHLTDFITFVLGNAGTGKTTVEYKLLMLMLKENNPNLSVWFNAPTTSQAEKLMNDVITGLDIDKFTINTLDKSALFERLGLTELWNKIKSYNRTDEGFIKYDKNIDKYVLSSIEDDLKAIKLTDLPNLILIDETTHYNALELELLNSLSKHLYNNGKYMKIVSAGDPTQRGAKFNDISYNVDRVTAFYTPILNLTVRASNDKKRENNDSLSAIVKKATSIFENVKDSPKILSLLDKGVNFKYYFDAQTINGDMLTNTEEIQSSIVTTLKNIIIKKPTTKIGILSKDGKLSEDLTKKFEVAGITSTNYVVYTPENVQGSESDYFIFNINDTSDTHVMSALRNLYTYMSRAKHGSIILGNSKTAKNKADDTVIPIISTKEDYTEPFEAMSPDIIKEIKLSKITQLEELLDGEFDTKYDNFKFDKDKEAKISIIEGESSIEIEEEELAEDEQFKGKQKPEKGKFLPDESKLMLHTFYNDLNVKIEDLGNGNVKIFKNIDNSLNTGLGFLFEEGENELTITKEEFDKIATQLITLKYKVLGDLKNKKLTSSILMTHDKLFNGANKIEKNIIIRKTKFNEVYNKPYKKELDDEDKHLKFNDAYPNLYLKVTTKNKTYYLHLGTLPALETVKSSFGPYSETNKYYEEYLKDSIDEDIIIPDEKVGFFTNTRLLYHKDDKGNRIKIQNINSKELKDLSNKGTSLENLLEKFPGLTFFDGKNFSSEPTIKLYPNTLKEYIQIFKNVVFNGEVQTDEVLEARFRLDSGKPYVSVSYVQSKNQVRHIKLISSNKKISQLKELFRNPFNRENSENLSKIIKSSAAEKPIALKIGESMFSGSQVLDMLINLAVDKPELFKQFFNKGEEFLKVIKETLEKDKSNKTDNVGNLFETLFNEDDFTKYKKDLIATIFYEPEDGKLREVLSNIREELDKNADIDKEKLRAKLLPKVSGGSNKYWFHKFWNIIRVAVESETVILKDTLLLEKTKSFSKIVNDMVNYWGENPGIFYYNLPITVATKGTSNIKPFDLFTNKENLYTTLVPEGPRMFLDLKEIFKAAKKKSLPPTPPEETAEETALREMNEKKENLSNEIVNNATTDQVYELGFTGEIGDNRINFKTWLLEQSVETLEKFLETLNEEGEEEVEEIDLEKNKKRVSFIFNNFILEDDVNGGKAHHSTMSKLFKDNSRLALKILENLDQEFKLPTILLPGMNDTLDKLVENLGTEEIPMYDILEQLGELFSSEYDIEIDNDDSAAELTSIFKELFPEEEVTNSHFTECAVVNNEVIDNSPPF